MTSYYQDVCVYNIIQVRRNFIHMIIIYIYAIILLCVGGTAAVVV